jgi:hypothetical protein
MSIGIADTEQYREALETVLKAHASEPVDLMIVDDVAEWAKGRIGNAKGNPIAMSVVATSSGAWGIVMRREMSAERIRGVLDRMVFGGYLNAAELLNEPLKFLEHLVLHELAHLRNKWGQDREDDCDEWAFERAGRAAI